MIYRLDTIQTVCGAIVLLRYVESFGIRKKPEEMIDRLADDCCFTIGTISGREYQISSKLIATAIGIEDVTYEEIAQAIYDKWKFMHREK